MRQCLRFGNCDRRAWLCFVVRARAGEAARSQSPRRRPLGGKCAPGFGLGAPRVRCASFDVCSILKRGYTDCPRFVSVFRPPIEAPWIGGRSRLRPRRFDRTSARAGAPLVRRGDRTLSLILKGVLSLLGRSFRESASLRFASFRATHHASRPCRTASRVPDARVGRWKERGCPCRVAKETQDAQGPRSDIEAGPGHTIGPRGIGFNCSLSLEIIRN